MVHKHRHGHCQQSCIKYLILVFFYQCQGHFGIVNGLMLVKSFYCNIGVHELR
jgi:hypothetical protein